MKLLLLIALAVVAAVALVPLETHREVNRGSYLITMKDSATAESVSAIKNKILGLDPVNTIDFEYTIINGFSAHLSKETLRELRHLDFLIELIEEDGVMHAFLPCSNQGTPNVGAWGIRRTSTSGCNGFPSTYQGPSNPGAETINYILDTGVLYSHNEFTGRTVLPCFSAISGQPCSEDGNGHGTHVAGTVVGTTVGLARSSMVSSSKVLSNGGTGNTSGVVAGVDFAVNDARSRNALCDTSRGCKSTANMSLGGGASTTLDNAVNSADNAGLLVVVAAGNANFDACAFSPARATGAYTVASSTETDGRSSFSNFGSCVNVFAPGSNIYSAWFTSNDAYHTISGTSMASPHVAGVASLFMNADTYTSTAVVKNAITETGNTGCISNPNNTPNILAFSCA